MSNSVVACGIRPTYSGYILTLIVILAIVDSIASEPLFAETGAFSAVVPCAAGILVTEVANVFKYAWIQHT